MAKEIGKKFKDVKGRTLVLPPPDITKNCAISPENNPDYLRFYEGHSYVAGSNNPLEARQPAVPVIVLK